MKKNKETDKTENDSASGASEIRDLLEIMSILRGENGCPWDKKQDLESLRPYVLEEAYEVVEAIDMSDMDMLKEELGDLLLQVVFQARLAEEKGEFAFEEIVSELKEKLIRRHPHVFAGEEADTPSEVRDTWEKIKAREAEADQKNEVNADDSSGSGSSILSDLSKSKPALHQAYEIQEKAAEVGFDWEDLDPVLAKIEEEIGELRESIEKNHPREEIEGELGDSLFALVNLSRFLSLDPELALLSCVHRFKKRFRYIEERAGAHKENIQDFSLKKLDSWWEEAKSAKSEEQK